MNLNSIIDNVVLCFIVPPSEERRHSSWRAIVYAREQPDKVYHGHLTLPTKIISDAEVMKQELCDPDHIPAHIVQITEKDQYVYIEGDVCEMLSVEVTLADSSKDPYLKRCQAARKKSMPSAPKSKLVLPGQNQSQPSGVPLILGPAAINGAMVATGPTTSLEDLYIVDVTFKTHGIKDKQIVDHVKSVAWNYGLKY